MKRNEWLIVMLPLLITWYLDRVTKLWATDLVEIKKWGVLLLSLHYNPGVILGLFSDLPPVLRVVSLSTGGAFLVCTYAFIQYLLPIRSILLRVGMSILLGGIVGNVTDRVFWGHIVDFISIVWGAWSSPIFNIADLLQWVGYGCILTAIVKEGETLWPEYDVRRQYWINPRFQLKYCYLLMGIGFGISLIAMVFSYTYLRVTMLTLVGNDPQLLLKFLTPFAFTFLAVTLGVSVGLFTVGKIISHRIAGPIYAFEKYVDELLRNPGQEPKAFNLRSRDEFKNLEILAARIAQLQANPASASSGGGDSGPSSGAAISSGKVSEGA
ncbi:MAG: signal peptidase II [Bdellovibrio sp.]